MSRKTSVSTMKSIGTTSARRVSAYRLSEVPLPPAMDASCLSCTGVPARTPYPSPPPKSAGAPSGRPRGAAVYDLLSFQYRMMNAASSVLGMPRTFGRAAAIMLPCQTGMTGVSTAATRWICLMMLMRFAVVFAACSALSSAVIFGVA